MGNMSGSYGSHYTIWLNIKTNSQNVANNLTNVTTELYLSFDGSTYWATQYNTTSGNMVVLWDGVEKVNQNYSISQIVFASGQKKDVLLASWTGDVPHDSLGKRKITVSGSWDTQTSRIGTGVSTVTDYELKEIQRYPSFTTNPYVTSRALNSITFNYGAVNMASSIYYSLDNSNWTPIYNQTTTISGLSPNTNYTVYVQARNQQNHSLYTTKSFQTSTLDIARIATAPNFNDEGNPTITYTNPSGGGLTKLEACISFNGSADDIKYREISKTGTSYTFNLTDSERNVLRNGASNTNNLNVIFFLRTTMGTNTYHSTINKTLTIINANPVFSNFDYNDTDEKILSLTGNKNVLVKGYSDVVVTISNTNKAQAKKSASIKTYKVVIGNQSKTFNYSSNSDVSSEILYNVNNNVIDVYATDTRDNSVKVSKTVTIKDYFAPQIQVLTANRENGIGEKVILDFKINFWNENFGAVQNALKNLIYRYKTTGSSTYINGTTELTYDITGNIVTGTIELSELFEINDTYNIQLSLNDELNSTSSIVTIGAGNPALAIYKNRVAVGQKYNESSNESLQVHGKIKGDDNFEIKSISDGSVVDIKNQDGNVIKNLRNSYFLGIRGIGWKHLCNIQFSGQGQYAVIDCYFGQGQNGQASQNTHARILLKEGWSGETLPVGVTVQFIQNYVSAFKVKIAHISKTNCALYVYLNQAYSDFTYTLNGSYDSINIQNLDLSSEPTTDKEATYYKNYKPEILFEGSTTGNIALTNNATSYTEIEIFASRGGYSIYKKILPKIQTYFTLEHQRFANDALYTYVKEYKINGTTLENQYTKIIWNQGGTNFAIGDEPSGTTIHKVVGYW